MNVYRVGSAPGIGRNHRNDAVLVDAHPEHLRRLTLQTTAASLFKTRRVRARWRAAAADLATIVAVALPRRRRIIGNMRAAYQQNGETYQVNISVATA